MDDKVLEMNEGNGRVRRPYATWTVGGQEYRLKLTTDAIEKLEAKYGKNLVELISESDLPRLSVMLDIIHGSLQKYHHNMNMAAVKDIFENYVEEGGSQLELLTEIIMPTLGASGFFPQKMRDEMEMELT